ncbi:hypothetical protein F2Q69_00012731 [Brassica cretica]|uniref:Uncharacterized protein n=1 Tax=Brassica cretica TaxID=69181 RepID=A0A8S9R615_BRACR|nr:hypothetical protein F2Q69_00012731 [Brassica cretica]
MYCVGQCGALVRVGDLIANKLAEPANIYNPILYSYYFIGGFSYVTNTEGGSEILFDTDIPEIQFFESQIPIIDF